MVFMLGIKEQKNLPNNLLPVTAAYISKEENKFNGSGFLCTL